MNVADSDEMARYLAKRGWEPTCDPDEATIYLVNTCTVRQHAEDRALSDVHRKRLESMVESVASVTADIETILETNKLPNDQSIDLFEHARSAHMQ